jgi:hypothetical protein
VNIVGSVFVGLIALALSGVLAVVARSFLDIVKMRRM